MIIRNSIYNEKGVRRPCFIESGVEKDPAPRTERGKRRRQRKQAARAAGGTYNAAEFKK